MRHAIGSEGLIVTALRKSAIDRAESRSATWHSPRSRNIWLNCGFVGAPQKTQRTGRNQQQIAVRGMAGEQALSTGKRIGMIALRLHRPEPGDFGFEQ